MTKTVCQLNEWASHPISGEKMTSAKYCAELKIADAVPRSELGNQEATTRPLPGKDGASDRPTRNRSANKRITAVPAAKKPSVRKQ